MPNDLNQSLDSTIAAIRAQHADEMQACRDRTLAAEVRAELLQSHLTEARNAQASAERIAMKFVTQFGMVEKIFSEVKALALTVQHEVESDSLANSPGSAALIPDNRFAEMQDRLQAKIAGDGQ